MTTPNPVQVSKTSLWVALGVLGGGILTIVLIIVLVIVPNASRSISAAAPGDDYSDLVPEPLDTDDADTDVIEPDYGKLPSDGLSFEAGSAITEDITVSVLINMGGDGALDLSKWAFETPPEGFLSSYTDGTCTVSLGTFLVEPEEWALGDEEATYLAAERLIGLTDRSKSQVSEWGWAPESITNGATASFIENRWNGEGGTVHSAALRSVGSSGTGVLFHTVCTGTADVLNETVQELRPALGIVAFSFEI